MRAARSTAACAPLSSAGLLALRGAQILLVPAGFTLHTGRDHWEVLLRARAIENLCYVVAPAHVGSYPPNRQCFGRSMIVDPWGLVLAQAQDMPTVILSDIDLTQIERVRAKIQIVRFAGEKMRGL